MITSASAAASSGVTTRRPSCSALARLLLPSGRPTRTSTPASRRDSAWASPWPPLPTTAAAARGQADRDVGAGVAQRQRVGVPLAAVAEHGDRACLENRQVGVVVVE